MNTPAFSVLAILSQVPVWSEAQREFRNPKALHDLVCSRAGDGHEVTPELLGMTKRDFMHDRLLLIEVPGFYVVYSMDSKTSEVCVELASQYIPSLGRNSDA